MTGKPSRRPSRSTSVFSQAPPAEIVALALAAALVILFVVLVVGVGLAFFDLGGRREEEAERLELMIGRALSREVGRLPVVPVARVPRSARSPVVILEITGTVPTSELRDIILDIVERELCRLRPHYRIDNRLAVNEAAVPAA